MNSGMTESQALGTVNPLSTTANRQLFWWGDIAAIVFLGLSTLSARMLLHTWFATTDRVIFFLLISAGLVYALSRSKWQGTENRGRTKGVILPWTISTGCLVWGLLAQSALGLACTIFFTILGWCVGRIRGESATFGFRLALVASAPAFVPYLEKSGLFTSLRDFTIVLTSSLSDLFLIPHAKDGNQLIYGSGVVDDFFCIGVWDGILSAVGLSIAWALFRSRPFMNLAFSIMAGGAIWIAIRSAGLCALAGLSSARNGWYDFSFSNHVLFFALTIICLLFSDKFFSEFFKPIPLELDVEAPILAFSFNWICSFPEFKTNLPRRSESYSMWQQQMNLKGIEPSSWTDFRWLLQEYTKFFTNPAWTLAAVNDALRGWVNSRKRVVLYFTSPFVLLPLASLVIGLFALLGPGRGYVERLTEQSYQICSSERLEEHCVLLQEAEFCRAIGLEQSSDSPLLPEPIAPTDLRYLELLGIRIVERDPTNLQANYRLGLIWSASGKHQKAFEKMQELARGSLGEMPESNGWLAKELINRKAAGEAIDFQDILQNIDIGSAWNGIDSRLLMARAKIFADQGRVSDAIELTKFAVTLKPESILELARLYKALDHEDFASTAYDTEAFFLKRIDVPSEQELDRMSIAEVRVLLGQLDQAEAILLEGLERGIGGERTKRQLSEVQFRIYLASIKKLDNGEFSADLSLLEKAAATDSTNPNISAGVARLLPLKIKPTTVLLDILKQQIKSGTTSVAAHLSLGEGYYGIGRVAEAQEHWEFALQGDPNSVVGLNNLALSLARMQPPNLDRALELASRAHTIAPQNPSVLDTYGEILLLAGRPKDAVNKLELAIRYDGARIGTRKKLVNAYQAAGLDDMAKAQSAVIEQIASASESQGATAPKQEND